MLCYYSYEKYFQIFKLYISVFTDKMTFGLPFEIPHWSGWEANEGRIEETIKNRRIEEE